MRTDDNLQVDNAHPQIPLKKGKIKREKPLKKAKTEEQNKTPSRPDKKRKKAIGELIYALFCFVTTACFAIIPIVLFIFAGAIELKMENGYFFIIFVFLCSILAGFLLFYRRYFRRTKNAKLIYDAAKKIIRGEYEIDFEELEGDYKKIADALLLVSQRLKLADKEKNDFINDFSHELKTPIVSIRGFARLIAKGNLSDEEEKEYLSIIVSESDRLIDLTASTLMLDRLGSNLEIEMRYYNLSEQLRKTVLLLQNDWEKKDVEIEANFEDFDVYSNEELTSQLFLNVLQNAVKFSNPHGKIEMGIKKTDKHLHVLIRDYGVGMDDETKRRMYDKYFRGDKSRSTPGNGLGLSTVKKISELLNLDLKVVSEPNKGTLFTVSFKNK